MEELRQKLDNIIDRMRQELATLRTGRATPALIENLEVEYYGARSPLKALAAISTLGPREIVIRPWDKEVLQPIEKAISGSTLGLAPIADKDAIRLSIPPLTEERRREMAKLLGKYSEEARIRVRRERDETLKEVERAYKAKTIGEDERFRRKAEVQKTIDEANAKIEQAAAAKEKEIMTV